MSNGSQIGGVIGAAIGAWITQSPQGAQLGYAIGPVLGERREMAKAPQLLSMSAEMEAPRHESA